MNRAICCWGLLTLGTLLAGPALGQTTAPADANDSGSAAPGVAVPAVPPALVDANSGVVVPVIPGLPDGASVTVPKPPAASAPAPRIDGNSIRRPDKKYAKCLTWLALARKEAAGIPVNEQTVQTRNYLHGTLMTQYIKCGDYASAKAVYDNVTTEHRLLWLGPLVAGMLVDDVDRDQALALLGAVQDVNVRSLILRQIAGEMVRMEALDGLALARRLPPLDQTAVLGEWVMRLVLEGKMVNARIVAEGAPTAEMREAVGILDLAGRVAHGQKTIAEAQAGSGKSMKEFMPFVVALDWGRVKDLDPNVAKQVLRYAAPGLHRGAMEIGMAKNFIKQRRFQVAQDFANSMIRDLQSLPAGRIPGPVYMEIAAVLAGVGRFDGARNMFERGLASRDQQLSIDSILTFFDALIAADGGDMTDRLATRMPKSFQDQVTRLWARHYIESNQPDRVRELLGKQKDAESRAWLYVGVATALREKADEPATK